MDRFAESEEHYLIAIQQSPDDAETRFLLARVLAAQGNLDRAIEQLAKALQVNPGMQKAIIMRGELEARRQP